MSERKYSLLEAKAKLEALCAYQERCAYELRKKMIAWKVDAEDQDRLLADLITHNFLNEQRFAEAFVSGKVRIKRWGRIKIKQELKQRHISDYSIRKGLESIDLDEYWKNLLHLTERKWLLTERESDGYKRKAKVIRFLNAKGYESDLIRDALAYVTEGGSSGD